MRIVVKTPKNFGVEMQKDLHNAQSSFNPQKIVSRTGTINRNKCNLIPVKYDEIVYISIVLLILNNGNLIYAGVEIGRNGITGIYPTYFDLEKSKIFPSMMRLEKVGSE